MNFGSPRRAVDCIMLPERAVELAKWRSDMLTLRTSRQATSALVMLAIVAGASEITAQTYPSNVIRIQVGSNPSSPPDIISRIIAAELSEREGWRVVVENKPGAIYTAAANEVLKHPADGHFIWAYPMPAAVAPALLRNLPFKLETDLVPVIKFSRSYNVLVLNPSVPARSMTELVAHLKANPNKLNFSSGGFGTPAHMIGELFKLQMNVSAAHVPYPGGLSKAIADLLNGSNHYQFISTLPVVELIAAGKLRAIAVTGPSRIPALSDVPTVVEQGYPDLVVEDWVGFAVKRGTPAEFVARLNAALNTTLTSAKVRDALAKVGAEPVGGNPTEFAAFANGEIKRWEKVVKESGISVDQR
jgi:tripartite-type tricarboxylate transporter receptor subunit TctC